MKLSPSTRSNIEKTNRFRYVKKRQYAWLGRHVGGGVDVDQRADAGDDEDHHRGERIEREVEVEVDRADADHLPGVAVEVASLVGQADELDEVDDDERKGGEHRADGDRA